MGGDIRDHLWSQERTDQLKKLWNQDLSAGQIAKILGGFEHCDDPRSAVIGKVHRLKQKGELVGRQINSASSLPLTPTRKPTDPVLKYQSSTTEDFSPLPKPNKELPADVIRTLWTTLYPT
jgi:hypothetical protein